MDVVSPHKETVRLRLALIVGALLICGFMWADIVLLPDNLHDTYFFNRLYFQVPTIVLVVGLSYAPFFYASLVHFCATWISQGRNIHDALGSKVPIGLISSNWGGTPVQVWQPQQHSNVAVTFAFMARGEGDCHMPKDHIIYCF